MTTTHNHPSQPVTLKDTGYRPEILYSTVLNVNMRTGEQSGPKKSKGGKRKYDRNRMGKSHANQSKYVASGGLVRQAERKARNMRRQAMLKTRNAERRMNATDRRLDRRLLKAAEQLLDRLD